MGGLKIQGPLYLLKLLVDSRVSIVSIKSCQGRSHCDVFEYSDLVRGWFEHRRVVVIIGDTNLDIGRVDVATVSVLYIDRQVEEGIEQGVVIHGLKK